MSTLDINIFFAFCTALLITYIAIPKVIFFSEKFKLFDSAGKRASHEGSTPVFGGIAIFAGIIFSLLFWANLENIQYILVSFLVVFFVGIIDDLLTLSPVKKLIGQIISILIIIYLGDLQIDNMYGVLGVHVLPAWASTSFTIFVVIVIANGFNLIDGVDGLAGGLGMIAAFSFGVISLFIIDIPGQVDMAIIAFTLMGALLGFLKYNLHPSKIFMGDTGSLVVGIILAVLAINTIKHGLITETIHFSNKGPLLAIMILAIPLFDSLRVFIVRIVKGRHPLYPGREHIHHALLKLGFGHTQTSLILCVFAIILIVFSYFLLKLNINYSIAILAVISFSLLLIPFYLLKDKLK
ncbi:undecaprenyl/decaprenyl-phosphate alpha-N-acetylglucosaminyl 1-phosphate transferase [Flavobacteriales bacterium]|nr:undecaprenyl/decaprenyl-phosphate alpha-N-acetylglucosaminyl 1-phosphate transferase [Flavobacteriales bacterium]